MDRERAERDSPAKVRTLRTWAEGEAAALRVGLPVALVVFGSLAASGGWFLRTHQRAMADSRIQQIEAMGAVLSPSAETMLAAGELSA